MKLMTFNVRIDVEVDKENNWKFRYQKIAEYINQENPHVIGMQEANIPMLDDLKPFLKNYQVIGEPRNKGGETTAIWIRKDVPFTDERTIFLTSTPNVPSVIEGSAFPRIATFIRISDDKGEFLLVNTHLDYLLDDVKKRQMEHLLDTLPVDERIVLMGDFNQGPNGPVHQLLEQHHFISTYQKDELGKASFHAFTGETKGEPIDFIYVKGFTNIPIAEIDQECEKDFFLSDHYPVIIDY